MSTKRRSRASAGRRGLMLDAALDLFLEAGVGNCRVEDLFARSGASVGSFYHHFGSKPALAAALYLEILEKFQADFLTELHRSRSARAGIQGMVRHQLRWVATDPQRSAYLFQCLEPEVFTVCHEDETRLTTAFFAKCGEWLQKYSDAGHIRRMSFLEYYALWMGPTLELTRAWLMNSQGKWTWMSAEQCRPAGLLGMEKTLADAAWQALRARSDT